MIAVLAEKPSVAREIATVLGATKKNDGYLEGNGYVVTWAFGHLIELAAPAAYGYVGFKADNLPILPDAFQYTVRQTGSGKDAHVDSGARKQLGVIKEIFTSCEEIIVATDAGREGELIFRYIYDFIHCTKPFRRLWISSLTDNAIRRGFHDLKSGRDYDRLYLAGKCRSEADWCIGMNATQAITIASGGHGVRSLGRVQTPVLRMICDRYLENKNFVPQKYWQLKLQTEASGVSFFGQSVERFHTAEESMGRAEMVRAEGRVRVLKVEKKESCQEPPLLFDLTALQKEANVRYNYSAETTLNIAQRLYEAKLITYPRTGSQYIPEDVYATIPGLITLLQNHSIFGSYASTLKVLYRRCVNDTKVTDHHALIITENAATDLNEQERAIYDLIAGRMLEAFSGKCIKDVTTVLMESAGVQFDSRGSIVKQVGWRAVYGETKGEKADESEAELPPLNDGMVLSVLGVESLEKQTKPKPLYTEATLLAAMETAGKELEDEELRAALKGCGLGTPATRAAIIEILFKRNYIERQKKTLIPTTNGLAVYNVVKDLAIADVEMTGKWENALSKIESGSVSADKFNEEIRKYARKITEELLSCKIEQLPGSSSAPMLLCPKCRKESVRIYPKVAKCTAENCDFVVFRSVLNKTLTEKQLSDLITKGATSPIKGLIGKSGKAFTASLKFTPDFKTVFDFDNH